MSPQTIHRQAIGSSRSLFTMSRLHALCASAFLVALGLTLSPSHGSERVIRAGTPEGLPGYALDAEGRLIVQDPDRRPVFMCIERRLNARFAWQALPTKRVVQGVVTGDLDLAFPMGFTAERAGAMRQSAPTWDNPDVWLSLRPVSIEDKSLRIAARLGSPQQVEYAADGYTRVSSATTYTELGRTLALDMADVVIVPRSVYLEQKALWPANTIVTVGRPRSSGFYLPPNDPKGLMAPLNRAIEACRTATH
jgi:hypothetical protein